MTDFGNIFDYQLSTMGLECLTLAFAAGYALVVARLVTSAKGREFRGLLAS